MFRLFFVVVLTASSLQAQDKITSPPASLKVSRFYRKYINANGFPIVSSAKVNDYALREAAYLVNLMLGHRADLRKEMIRNGSRLVVMAWNEMTTDIPEHADLRPKDYWDRRARGLGGSRRIAACSVGEENLLSYPGDPYRGESILIHEFAHSIHLRGMNRIDRTFDARLKQAYDLAIRRGLWRKTYASTNHKEYWAEGVQSWFDTNLSNNNKHNDVSTREKLVKYDPALAKICREVFGEKSKRYSKPLTRLVKHLRGYDPKAAPTFRWAKGLKRFDEYARLKWNVGKAPKSKVGRTSSWILFQNMTRQRLRFHWISYSGERKFYGNLPVGGMQPQRTYAGSAWLITDEKNNPLGYFLAKAGSARAVVPRKE